ncbi:DEAD/DEAH box helicase [Sessilibacter corallicola]|uniref:Superfamily II DNA or RNA helicase n=1 Tax=Sessilibacter corallicola TaxID=2904075 RepID=A0ABQ0A8E1_9GAMM
MPNVDLAALEEQVVSESSDHAFLAYKSSVGEGPDLITERLREDVMGSWRGCLSIVPLDALSISDRPSLRQPQVAALFEILGHLTSHRVSDATVVMPTGTGKTETMLAAVCGLPVERALVIVPTDSLRLQTFKKFLELGKLRELNAINSATLNPVTALLEGAIDSEDELNSVLKANVIVTTPFSLHQVSTQLKSKLYDACSHLFVDEAHHVKANTWMAVKKAFSDKPVIQFTATPFREDRKRVGGKIIYNYPMSKAQENGLFREITFKAIYEVNDITGDERVAEEAVSQLRRDLHSGYDHILMARCSTRKRAEKIFEIYQNCYSDLNPIVIHSGVSQKTQKMQAILQKKHRIIVCVDMLGEGFDLPELKVCALHNIHKSLPITLQFAGRFVRDRSDLGNPTFIANVCDQNVENVLKDLYIEDPDWNRVLQRISENSIQQELELQELVDGAIKTGIEVPPENLNPALSAIVYRASSLSMTEKVESIPLERNEVMVSSFVAPEANLSVLLTKVESKTKWAPQSDFTQPEWRLIMLYYVPGEELLFIHDSSKSGVRKKIAEHFNASASLLSGDSVFKSFGHVERLVLQNAGLNRGRRGPLRYVMYTGIDIESAINDLAQGASYKSNLFGKGYDTGNKVSIGCSYKGRIWSMDSASISDWMAWCRSLAKKLNDPEVDPNQILNKVLRTNELESIPPDLVPVGIDWPDLFYERGGLSTLALDVDGTQLPVDEAIISIAENAPGVIKIQVDFDRHQALYEYSISNDGYSIVKAEGSSITLIDGEKRKDLAEYFSEEASPAIYFDDGSKLFETLHIVRPEGYTIPHISSNNIHGIPWAVNIRSESQGESRNSNTIQHAMIQRLLADDYWIVFDDDGPNEVADIVAFKDEGNVLAVEFYHLKYSKEDAKGSRIGDFYEVCGQVIKSCKWVGELDNIINQLKSRERKRINRSNITRLEKGHYRDFDLLKQHGARLKKDFRFFVVQPGLDSSNVSEDVAALLGSVDLYVKETTGNPLKIICS